MNDDTGRRGAKVLFLTQGRHDAAARFRVYQYLSYFRAAGLDPVVVPCRPERSFTAFRSSPILWPLRLMRHAAMAPSRARGLVEARKCDVVFLQRDLWWGVSPYLERAIARVNNNIVFDFDDAIWLYYRRWKTNPIASIARQAKLILAGNSYLAEYVMPLCEHVKIVPTPVDTARIRPHGTSRGDGVIRILWTGSSSTLPDLRSQAPALAEVCRRERECRVVVVADRPPTWEVDAPIEFVPWNKTSEVAELERADIGIMPLPDSPWTRGKCSFKLLQYMAAGLPAVASPVGMNREVMRDCLDGGIVAESHRDWVEALVRLIRNPSLRAELGERGRARVVRHYSLECWGPQVAAMLAEQAQCREGMGTRQ